VTGWWTRSAGSRARAAERSPVYVLQREQFLPVPAEEAFDFFADAFNLELITPPWLNFRVDTPRPIEMRAGSMIEYRLRLHGVPVRWLTRIESWEPGARFADVQLRGPYRHWHHTHTFEARDGGTLMRDVVRYSLPLGPLGRLARALVVRRDLDRIFDFRRDAVAARFPS
jgi:ligand-binding SRPBCC domain-containing protein